MASPKRRKALTVQEMAKLGGKARWAGVSSSERSAIARKAVRARWERAKARKAEKAPKTHQDSAKSDA